MSDRVGFIECLFAAARTPTLVAEFDRLRGTNLSLRGDPLDLMIDEASGRLHHDLRLFVEFVWECVYTRLPDGVRGETFP